MVIDISEIDAIVFDLGGVIIDLSLERTFQAFAELGNMPVEEVKALANEEFFKLYETGAIDDPTFRAHLREALEFKGPDAILDEAWNAMLGPISLSKFRLMEQLSRKYRLFVMSNTNQIHIRRILKIADHISPAKGFYQYFERVFLSNEVGERKPEVSFYEYLMKEARLTPEKTFFMDDNEENTATARSLGWKAHHLKPGESIEQLLRQAHED